MTPVRAAAGLVGLEAFAGLIAGLGFLVAVAVGSPSDAGTAVVLGVLLVVYGVGMLLIARGIARGSARAWTPAFLVQFFALVVAWYQRHTLLAVTVVLTVVAVVTAATLAVAVRRQD